MQRKVFWTVLLAMWVFACSGCGASGTPVPLLDVLSAESTAEEGDTVEYIFFAHSEVEGSQTDQAAQVFKQALETASDGQMSAEIYANIFLGNSKENSLIMNGGVDIGICGGPSSYLKIAQWLPVLNGMDKEDILTTIMPDGALWPSIEQECASAGVRFLGYTPAQSRFLASTREIVQLTDLQGLTLRSITGLSGDEKLWRSLGAETTELDLTDLNLALQLQQVHGQVSTLSSFMDGHFYEQEQYILATDHELYIRMVLASSSFYDSLTVQQQGWLNEAVGQMLDWLAEEQAVYEEESYCFLDNMNVQVYQPSDALRQAWMQAMYPVVEENLYQRYGRDMIEEVLALVEP